MPPSVMSRSEFQRTLFPGINQVIGMGEMEFPEEFSQIFRIESSDSAFEEDYQVAGGGLFRRTPENVEVAQTGFKRGFPKRYTHEDYTLAIGASYQMRRDMKIGLWKDRARDMGFSHRQTKEILYASLFDGGFSVANGPDGQPLFSATHPNPGIGVQNNILNPVGTINVLSVRLALTQMRRFFDPTGVRRIKLMPRWLWHAPEEWLNVDEVLKSTERPDTANRATNVLYGKLTPFTWDYLSDANNWGLLTDKNQHYLKGFNRTTFTTKEWLDDFTDIQWVIARFAFSFGFSDWIGTLGSNPA